MTHERAGAALDLGQVLLAVILMLIGIGLFIFAAAPTGFGVFFFLLGAPCFGLGLWLMLRVNRAGLQGADSSMEPHTSEPAHPPAQDDPPKEPPQAP